MDEPTPEQDAAKLEQGLRYAAELRRLYALEKSYREQLAEAWEQMAYYAQDVRRAYDIEKARRRELEEAYFHTVKALAAAIEARDPYTGGHVERVAEYAVAIARELGWTEDRIAVVRLGAALHDVGKIGVDDAILRKPASLSEQEWALMRMHPEIGARLLQNVPFLLPYTPVVLHHQERWDGKGYPHGLSGEQIPAEARVVAVADAFDAMTTTRPYRAALPEEAALEEIQRHAGSQFDPEAAAAFLHLRRRGRL